jgi:hypothetical protein
MSILYCTNTGAECAAILRDGFSDEPELKPSTGKIGVYLSDCPGEPDPDYPDDQLLEITLPPEISISQYEIFVPKEGTRWREFVVPAHILNESAEIYSVPKTEWDQKLRQWKKQWIDSQTSESHSQPKRERPDPEIIRENAEAFEALAMRWFDSLTGKLAFPNRADLRTAVLYMILTYFDSANEPDLYFGDLMRAVEEKLRLDAIKHGGLKGLPEKKDLGQN